jgi:hypothetical protein
MKMMIYGGLAALLLSEPALAQGYPPTILQQAPPDPHQFCYYNGAPYSLGSPYPGSERGKHGGRMHCRVADQAVNGYLMLEWSDDD